MFLCRVAGKLFSFGVLFPGFLCFSCFCPDVCTTEDTVTSLSLFELGSVGKDFRPMVAVRTPAGWVAVALVLCKAWWPSSSVAVALLATVHDLWGGVSSVAKTSLVLVAVVIRVMSVLKNKAWRRKWKPTPIFLPGESHGWKNLADYSPWD